QSENPRVLLDSHIDEIGFIVQRVTSSGYVKFLTVGGWWAHSLLAQRVSISTKRGVIPGVIGSDLLRAIPELCASTGAACHSGTTHLSDTLKAIDLSPEVAAGTVRLSVGWYTTEDEIDRAADLLLSAWENLK
ncbi:MAG: hypothetical protein IH991_20415, partial [Planctomycetes bacterium]|nr:hypothetical protein [Planctomycetota bacterium]